MVMDNTRRVMGNVYATLDDKANIQPGKKQTCVRGRDRYHHRVGGSGIV